MAKRTKILTIAALAVTLLIFVGLISRYYFLPNYRPGLSENQAYGIDVSHHQGKIDWKAVKADSIDYAYIKASEGGDWTDKRFQENWNQAREAGLKVGAYHFFTLCTDGAAQAKQFLKVVDFEKSDLPPALDIELGGNCSNPPSDDQIQAEISTFLEVIEAETDTQTVLYILEGFDYLSDDTIDRPMWKRSLFRKPKTKEWQVWQYSGISHVDGIDGPVDMNVFNLDLR